MVYKGTTKRSLGLYYVGQEVVGVGFGYSAIYTYMCVRVYVCVELE